MFLNIWVNSFKCSFKLPSQIRVRCIGCKYMLLSPEKGCKQGSTKFKSGWDLTKNGCQVRSPKSVQKALYGRSQSGRGKALKSGFVLTMYYDILTSYNLLTWLGMTIYVNKPEATDNMQLIEHI